MHRGPPYSGRTEAERIRLEESRGSIRDALGGLRNLEQLLGSLRVGPRALTAVLPDVQRSCPGFRTGLLDLFGLLVTHCPVVEPALRAFEFTALPQLVELERELGLAASRPLNAKARLRLDAQLNRAIGELEPIVDVTDWLSATAFSLPVELSVRPALLESLRASEPEGLQAAATAIVVLEPLPELELSLQPRFLAGFVAFAARALADQHPTRIIEVCASEISAGHARLTVSASTTPRQGMRRWVPGKGAPPAWLDCLRAGASLTGAELEVSPDLDRIELGL